MFEIDHVDPKGLGVNEYMGSEWDETQIWSRRLKFLNCDLFISKLSLFIRIIHFFQNLAFLNSIAPQPVIGIGWNPMWEIFRPFWSFWTDYILHNFIQFVLHNSQILILIYVPKSRYINAYYIETVYMRLLHVFVLESDAAH